MADKVGKAGRGTETLSSLHASQQHVHFEPKPETKGIM
jgi:hypothetical protein